MDLPAPCEGEVLRKITTKIKVSLTEKTVLYFNRKSYYLFKRKVLFLYKKVLRYKTKVLCIKQESLIFSKEIRNVPNGVLCVCDILQGLQYVIVKLCLNVWVVTQ